MQFVNGSKAFLCCPLIIIWAAKMSPFCLSGILLVLQADAIKVLLAVPLKQRFLKMQPCASAFISSWEGDASREWLIQQSLEKPSGSIVPQLPVP